MLLSLPVRAAESTGARVAVDDSATPGSDGFRNVPVKQLDTCVGQYVRLHFPGDKVREGKLKSCENGWVTLEQKYGANVMTVRLVEKHIDKVELQTDPSQPIRRTGTMSVVDQSQALTMSGGGESYPSSQVTVVGRKAAPNCRLAR
jgi:hypothetical protein